MRELAVGAHAAVAFVEYPHSPEAQYPVAIEQGYATAQWIIREGAAQASTPSRMAVAGESVGGNMAAALALDGQGPRRRDLCPAVDVLPGHRRGHGHRSYDQFATGYYLTRKAMEWFWDAYIPDTATRSEITLHPTRPASSSSAGLPPALLFVDEADVVTRRGRGLRGQAARRRCRGDDRALPRRRP